MEKSAQDLINEGREELPYVQEARAAVIDAIESARQIVYEGDFDLGEMTVARAVSVGVEVANLLDGFTSATHRNNVRRWVDNQPSADIRLFLLERLPQT